MAMNENYKVWMRWRLEHEYYGQDTGFGLVLSLKPCCRESLRKRNLIFRPTAPGEWCLLGNERSWSDEEEFFFELKITDTRLLYVTEGEIPQEYASCLQETDNTIVLGYKAKTLVWEYILIPRTEREYGRLELTDMSGRLAFKATEPVWFMGKEVLKIETENGVPLREYYDYQIRLWEHRALGRKVLCNRVAFPVPGAFLAEGQGRIRQVIYF